VGIDVLLVNAIDRLPLEVMLDRYGWHLVLAAPEKSSRSYWASGGRIDGLQDLRPARHAGAFVLHEGGISSACRPTPAPGWIRMRAAMTRKRMPCLLADPHGGRAAECRERADVRDMDEWGYTFRLRQRAALGIARTPRMRASG